MNRLVIIPDAMEAAMTRDLDNLRDRLPPEDRAAFDDERDVHRQAIVSHWADYGSYPKIAGVEKKATT
jgi:hypothetical protein